MWKPPSRMLYKMSREIFEAYKVITDRTVAIKDNSSK
jgi:hypothetical protein